MDEREVPWLAGHKVYRNAEHYLAERRSGLTELGRAPLSQRHVHIIERRRTWRAGQRIAQLRSLEDERQARLAGVQVRRGAGQIRGALELICLRDGQCGLGIGQVGLAVAQVEVALRLALCHVSCSALLGRSVENALASSSADTLQ